MATKTTLSNAHFPSQQHEKALPSTDKKVARRTSPPHPHLWEDTDLEPALTVAT